MLAMMCKADHSWLQDAGEATQRNRSQNDGDPDPDIEIPGSFSGVVLAHTLLVGREEGTSHSLEVGPRSVEQQALTKECASAALALFPESRSYKPEWHSVCRAVSACLLTRADVLMLQAW
jgi:hypothetical protein